MRRLIAGRHRGARAGVVVGSWAELVDWARRAYLLPAPAEDWDAVLRDALGGLEDAFWAESLSVAPDETARAVSTALAEVIGAGEPGRSPALRGLEDLSPRPRRHLEDLARLAESLAGRLPPELAGIRDLLAADRGDALRTLRVEHVHGAPALTRWQTALVGKLNRDSSIGPDAGLLDVLSEVLTAPVEASPRGALGVLQSRLYQPATKKVPLDDSVQWLGVRDFLQEAEVAAGVVQRLLANEPGLEPAQIGLLLPESFEYAVAVEDAFRLGGIALSGLPAERWRRDLGREALFHFLYCRQKPAPAMALAVCLSSPLMPWSRDVGAVLAQTVMDGDYALEPPHGASGAAREMLDLLREGDRGPSTLVAALTSFVRLLDGGEALASHVAQARAALEPLLATLSAMQEIDWTVARRSVIPRFVTSGESAEFNLEGVTVWRESQEPWRAVRRLIVLGFAQGRYPAGLPRNPVFASEDLAAIRDALGLSVTTPAEELARRRERFRRQLGAASESVTFLVPRRDPGGARLAASESLVFMHRLYTGPEAADELVVDLDAASGRAQARDVAFAEPARPEPPRVLASGDLEFRRDLLTLRLDEHGTPRPESPTSLETLMVSGLAWLLRALDAEPLGWAPEAAGPLLLGSVAHEVFEGLFPAGGSLPEREAIPAQVDARLDEALRRRAPFLRSSQWKVERQSFAALTARAALAWRDALGHLGAQVVAAESRLAGTWHGIAVHGQTDAILALPGDRLLVVDYKRSKSAKRLPQMQKGYDSQASLYRAMLQSGGPKDPAQGALATRLRTARDTGVVYYLMNDQVALSDTKLQGAAAVPGWRAIEGDIAARALALISARIDEVRTGRLRLNRVGDRRFFEQEAGLAPYALDASPLVGLYSRPDDGEAPA